jgi:hypothetical protein
MVENLDNRVKPTNEMRIQIQIHHFQKNLMIWIRIPWIKMITPAKKCKIVSDSFIIFNHLKLYRVAINCSFHEQNIEKMSNGNGFSN